MQATTRVLAREGYDRASTNRIAEVAGVSIGSIYQFFPNKEAIFAALRRRYFEELEAAFAAEAPTILELPPVQALRAGLGIVLKVRRKNRQLQKALDRELLFVLRNDSPLDRACFELAQEKVEQLPPSARPADLEMATRISVAVLDAITRMASIQYPDYLESEDSLDEVTELLWRFIDREGKRRGSERESPADERN